MGWEYGIRTLASVGLTEVMHRLAASLTYSSRYSLEHHPDGFVLLRHDASWPRALEVWLEEASDLDEVDDGEHYFYCLFHIWGEEGRAWMKQLQDVTSQYSGMLEWFEL